jgi:hypothetical protein
MDENAEIYWKRLSTIEKGKLLHKYEYWDGFKDFLYRYLPDNLKAIIASFLEQKTPE